MESALTPREIQSRIRTGESLDDVATAAGVPASNIEAFAAPVLAERRHIADLARNAQVRRRGEASAQRILGEVVSARLQARSIDPDTVTWDAWRGENRMWTVMASYLSGSSPHEATFSFDSRGRFSFATNEEARWLIGDESTAHGPQPGRKRSKVDADSEPTVDLNDELAIVRVVQDDSLDTIVDSPTQASHDDLDEDFEDELKDYAPAELEEVNGVYEIVDHPQSDMDILYDMLASFNEDSVNIYAGLTAPRETDEPSAQQPQKSQRQSVASSEQSSLLDDLPDDEVSTKPKEPQPAKPKSRKKRVPVPSWDEIMFGSPRTDRKKP